jgi:hypothetical protein
MLGAVHPVVPRGSSAILAEMERRMRARGLTDTLLHLELMVDEGDDTDIEPSRPFEELYPNPSLDQASDVDPCRLFEELDPNLRLVGAEVQWTMSEAWGISMGDVALDWALGRLRTDRLPTRPRAVANTQTFLGPRGGGRLTDLRLPEGPEVRWSVQFVGKGTPLPADPLLGGKVGGYLTVGASVADSLAASRALRHQVRINGAEATF